MKTVSPQQLAKFFDAASEVEGAFVVGGQALNIWAERYASRNKNLASYAPFTSKDLDYFGTLDVAQQVADRVDGELKVPKLDHHTPVTAALIAELDGEEIIIQFIDHVLGASDKDIKKRVAIISVPMLWDGEKVDVAISILHPFHCFVSRITNVRQLKRSDDTAMRQLNASVHVLREFINDLLIFGDTSRASLVLKLLYRFLRSQMYGRDAHMFTDTDPLEILNEFGEDERLDYRFRPHLKNWHNEVIGRRKNREKRLSALAGRTEDN